MADTSKLPQEVPEEIIEENVEEVKEEGNLHALMLGGVFGFNSRMPRGVHNLTDANTRPAITPDHCRALFYVAANTGVVYDVPSGKQMLLQGHTTAITCCAVSEQDKRWVATADGGKDCSLIVWDSTTGTPVKSLFRPHATGVAAMDMSYDAMYIATLSAGPVGEQRIAVWDWTSDREEPIAQGVVRASELQTCIRLHPDDPHEIVTNGRKRTIFWEWEDGAEKMRCYSPALSSQQLRHSVGDFTQSLFVPSSSRAISATVDGDVVLWDEDASQGRVAVKVLRLHESPINHMEWKGQYLVTGDEEGFVRFYDMECRLVAYYEDLEAGPIVSISFAVEPQEAKDITEQYETERGFSKPDFVISTAHAKIVSVHGAIFESLSVRAERRKGDLLVQGTLGAMNAIAVHPDQPLFASVGGAGAIQIWSWEGNRQKCVRERAFRGEGTALAYDNLGLWLAVGFKNGGMRLLNASTLEDVESGHWKNGNGAITMLKFSANSEWLVTADAGRSVAIYRRKLVKERIYEGEGEGGERMVKKWVYLGKYRTHSREICGLLFDGTDEVPRLLSLGKDRTLVEYDLRHSSVEGGILLKSVVAVEQTATPGGFCWHPSDDEEKERYLIMSNDEYKLRLLSAESKDCARLLLGPTYGGPITRMDIFSHKVNPDNPAAGNRHWMVYAADRKVVGLVRLPLDGNPHNGMGMIAHPDEIAALALVQQGQHVLTAGGMDQTVCLWDVDVSALDRTAAQGGLGMEPFLGMIEGGQDGPTYEEIIQYFYYAQLHSQGEETTDPRQVRDTIPLEEVANVMRAMGFYASEKEVQDVLTEARTESRASGLGDRVGLDQLIRLYVNHRSVFGITPEHIERAFAALGAEAVTGVVDREAFSGDLKRHGEPLGTEEFGECLEWLMGPEGAAALSEQSQISAKDFAKRVLGFREDGLEGSSE